MTYPTTNLPLEITIPAGFYAAGTRIEIRPGSSGSLARFDNTPHGVVCPHFWRLSLGAGCPFACDYCYLQGGATHRIRRASGRETIPVVFTDTEGMVRKVQRWMDRLNRSGEVGVLNVGELSDSLVFDDYTGAVPALIALFAQQDTHRLLTLTKSANVGHLLGLTHNGMTILSWSINAPEVARRFEGNAPAPQARIAAAKRAQEAGYPVRVRIDPMIPVDGWERHYRELVRTMHQAGLRPERFTLGTLRFFPSVRAHARRKDSPVFSMVPDRTGPDRRARVAKPLRVAMYQAVIEEIRAHYGDEATVGLCKETVDVREAVGVDHTRCNCTP